jgi:hypothetical protein
MIVLCSATSASADRVAVALLGGDPMPEAHRRAAVSALAKILEREGHTILADAEVRRRTPPGACPDQACRVAMRRVLGVDVLATVSLFAGAGSEGPGSVVVGVVRERAYHGTAVVHGAGLEAALGLALGAARERERRGAGPFLRVEGEPHGAMIELDGVEWAAVPHEARVEPGTHRVLVRLEGFAPALREVVLDEGAEEPLVVTVRLERAASARPEVRDGPTLPDPPPAVRDDDGRSLVGPLLLGGAGLVALGVGLGPLVFARCSVDAPDHECLVGDRVHETAAYLWIGAGELAVVGAVLWFVLSGSDEPVSGGDPADISLRF